MGVFYGTGWVLRACRGELFEGLSGSYRARSQLHTTVMNREPRTDLEEQREKIFLGGHYSEHKGEYLQLASSSEESRSPSQDRS